MTKEQKQLFKALKEAIKHGAIYKTADNTVFYSYKGQRYTIKPYWEPRARHISIVEVDENNKPLKEPAKKSILRQAFDGFCDLVDLAQNFSEVTVTDYSDPKSDPETIEYRGLSDLRLTLCRYIHGKRM